MADFTITEDFPKNEIEFDKRLSDPKACYEYLFKQKCQTVSSVKNAATANAG